MENTNELLQRALWLKKSATNSSAEWQKEVTAAFAKYALEVAKNKEKIDPSFFEHFDEVCQESKKHCDCGEFEKAVEKAIEAEKLLDFATFKAKNENFPIYNNLIEMEIFSQLHNKECPENFLIPNLHENVFFLFLVPLLELKREEEVLKRADEIINFSEANCEIWFSKAMAFRNLEKFDEMKSCLDKAHEKIYSGNAMAKYFYLQQQLHKNERKIFMLCVLKEASYPLPSQKRHGEIEKCLKECVDKKTKIKLTEINSILNQAGIKTKFEPKIMDAAKAILAKLIEESANNPENESFKNMFENHYLDMVQNNIFELVKIKTDVLTERTGFLNNEKMCYTTFSKDLNLHEHNQNTQKNGLWLTLETKGEKPKTAIKIYDLGVPPPKSMLGKKMIKEETKILVSKGWKVLKTNVIKKKDREDTHLLLQKNEKTKNIIFTNIGIRLGIFETDDENFVFELFKIINDLKIFFKIV